MNRFPRTFVPPGTSHFITCSPENADSNYVAYVSQQNLITDDSEEPVDHPAISGIFDVVEGNRYKLKPGHRH